MRNIVSLVFFVVMGGLAQVHAQQYSGPAPAPGSPSPAIVWQANFTSAAPGGGMARPYGSGLYPNLQSALSELQEAQNAFNSATIGTKREYLPRTILGVQMAIADVKLAIDFADGSTTPPGATLPALPVGLGNANSTEVALPRAHATSTSPNMELGLVHLSIAQKALHDTTAGNKGIFLPRAIDDVAFATENAIAATNLEERLPATQPKAPSALAAVLPPVAPSVQTFTFKEIGGALAVLVILIAIGVEQAVRKRKGR